MGHEQKGTGRAVAAKRQRKTSRLTFIPITTQIKGYPDEIAISATTANGKPAVALGSQIFTVDWRDRDAGFSQLIVVRLDVWRVARTASLR